jgi:hypothetical protein
MRTARVIELLSGLAAGMGGLLTLAYLLFGPNSHYIKNTTTCSGGPSNYSCTSTDLDHITSGAIRIYLFPLSIYLLSILALLFAVIAVSAALHSHTGAALWQACLWTSTLLLAGVLLLTLGSLIVALWPALLLALVASAAAWIAARQRAREREATTGQCSAADGSLWRSGGEHARLCRERLSAHSAQSGNDQQHQLQCSGRLPGGHYRLT